MPKIIRNEIEYASTTSTANQVQYNNTVSGLSATNVQGAIDEIDSDLSGKADKTSAVQIATFNFSKTVNATTQTTYEIARSDFNLPNNAVAVSVFLREYISNSVNAGGLVYSAYVNPTANNTVVGAIYNGTNVSRTYSITATLLYTLS